MKILSNLLLIVFLQFSYAAYSQNSSTNKTVFVDKNGVMKWTDSKEEVKGFGVNYTVPFAHAFRSAQKLGIDVKKAIDNDVYHFSRLGLDLFRVHVWDTQISDTLGNLVENEHLENFDYLLKKLKEKNINYVITPIAFWGNGWPEPDTYSPGFSHKYGKDGCLTNPEAIKAQEKYLYQFLNHVNPYTGIAYKDEPNVIAFEVSNEPHHKGAAKDVTKFVRKMVNSIRKTGTKKPIFYNISHGVHFVNDYFAAGINGGTFQWYPTGLGYQNKIPGNLVPNVNEYNIPFNKEIKANNGAKLVYEFDAADVENSYIYPIMARSFREAGIQIATHFSYDPTFLAFSNTEYNTHYMNLVYTPQKALGLMISSEIFHQIPMYANLGKYPQNLSFNNFSMSYEKDLAELNSEEKFLYTNSTKSIPKDEQNLQLIAGYGNSKLVKYKGTGAYFLDKIEAGIWRLEVLPDVIWIANPFGRNSLQKTVSVINWQERKMTLNLKELDDDFSIEAINKGNNFKTDVLEKSFSIKPGTYLIKSGNAEVKIQPNEKWHNGKLNDFFAPQTTLNKLYFNHTPTKEVSEFSELEINAQIAALIQPNKVELWAYFGYDRKVFEMELKNGYHYSTTIPKELLKIGYLNYHIVLKFENKSITFPANITGEPNDWDFYDRSTYTTRITPLNSPITLYNSKADAENLVRQWKKSLKLVPTSNENEDEYQINIENLFEIDTENLNASPIYDYSFKHFLDPSVIGKLSTSLKNTIVFKGRSLNDKPCKLQIAFVMKNGVSYGNIIEIGAELTKYSFSLTELKPVKTVTLPRPYPTFLPYFFDHDLKTPFQFSEVESIQFSIGPGISENQLDEAHGIGIVSVVLE